MKDKCYLKNRHHFGLWGAPLFYVHSAFCVDDVIWLHKATGAFFYSLWLFTENTTQNTTQKIKY